MNQPVISLNRVTKKLNQQMVLDNLNLKIYQGEMVGLVGPNGSGKTLLLNLLLGLVTPDAGSIKIFGLPLEANLSRIRSRINFFLPDSPLQLNTTSLENLLTYGDLYGVANCMANIRLYARMLDIDDLVYSRQKLFTFSSGQRTKISLCKALITQPELLLLDEPTTYLDQGSRRRLLVLLKRINQQRGTTIVVSSHQPREISRLVDRVLIIRNRKIDYLVKTGRQPRTNK